MRERMTKEMRDLALEIETMAKKAEKCLNGEEKDLAKAEELMAQIEEKQHEYGLRKKLFDEEKEEEEKILKNKKDLGKNEGSEAKFAKNMRMLMTNKRLQESYDTDGSGTDGGYTVPEDIQTKINYWRDVEFSLLSLISTENVTTNKGARTYQKKSTAPTLVKVDEGGTIANEFTAPQFERIVYEIEDYAGFIPVTRDLLADSDANITNVITKWIGDISRNTANSQILSLIEDLTEVDLLNGSKSLADVIDGIKKALNMTLGQAYKDSSIIVTNDDGLQLLDTLKDGIGRQLLTFDPTSPMNMRLSCGANVVPIKVIPNKVLKTSSNKIPYIIGDFIEAFKKWDRQSTEITASDVASIGGINAFAQNMTLFRVIERFDYKMLDKDAIVRGYVTVSNATEGE